MSKPIITQKQLKDIIIYYPDSGRFEWTEKKKWVNKKTIGHIDKDGYHSIMINKRNWRAHRLAWLYIYGEIPKQIDHINHIKNDNRLINLRAVTNQQNQMNRRYSYNTSGIMGVCFDKDRNKWKAQIKVNRESIQLGRYDDIAEAIGIRKTAELEYGFHDNHGIVI